mgnify:CR=1 FL=1
MVWVRDFAHLHDVHLESFCVCNSVSAEIPKSHSTLIACTRFVCECMAVEGMYACLVLERLSVRACVLMYMYMYVLVAVLMYPWVGLNGPVWVLVCNFHAHCAIDRLSVRGGRIAILSNVRSVDEVAKAETGQSMDKLRSRGDIPMEFLLS